MKFLTIKNNKIIGIRYGNEIINGEIESGIGELGQILLEDGTFIDDPQDIIDQQNAEKESKKRELIEKMIIANALRDDELWLNLKNEYDLLED
jgi:hypothetical protein